MMTDFIVIAVTAKCDCKTREIFLKTNTLSRGSAHQSSEFVKKSVSFYIYFD